MNPKLLVGAIVAFMTPLAIVGFMHREEVAKNFEIDPSAGHVLYFTMPG